MKKKLSLLLAMILIVSVVGCGAKEEAPVEPVVEGNEETVFADTNGDGKVLVGFSAFTFADAWMVSTDETLKSLCAEYGYEYTSQGAESNSATQANQIENMLTMGCDWMYVTVFEPEILKDVCIKAQQQNCNMIFPGALFDYETESDAFYGQFVGSQYDFGHLTAEIANEWVEENYPDAEEGSIECAVFVNSSTEDFQYRADAMKEIEVLNPKVKVVEVYDLVGQDSAAAKCQEYTDQLFMEHPDCKLVLSHSSDFAVAINENIMKTAGLDPASIAIFSCDWLEAAANLVKLSVNNESVLRGFAASGDLNATLIRVVAGEVFPENGSLPIELYKFDSKNIDEAFEMFGSAQ